MADTGSLPIKNTLFVFRENAGRSSSPSMKGNSCQRQEGGAASRGSENLSVTPLKKNQKKMSLQKFQCSKNTKSINGNGYIAYLTVLAKVASIPEGTKHGFFLGGFSIISYPHSLCSTSNLDCPSASPKSLIP